MPKPGSQVFPSLHALAIRPLSVKAFGLAVLATAGALGLRAGLGLIDPKIPPFATFFASILLTSIVAGVEAGLAAATLGFVAAWWAFDDLLPGAFTVAGSTLYVLSALIIIWVAEQYRTVLRRLQQKEAAAERQLALVTSENAVLEQIVSDAPLSEVLTRLTRAAEQFSGGQMLASILLMDDDGRHLRHGAAPSLPTDYIKAIDGIEIGPSVGSCGTAAFRRTPVYVTDIQIDPLWEGYRELAETHGLRACWSLPILSEASRVLGTFALYHREPREPTAGEKNVAELLTQIAGLAIEHHREKDQRQLLVGELVHRVKNILTVVQAIAARTIRPRIDAGSYKAFEERLLALSSAQRLLTEANWSSVDLHDLIKSVAISPFASEERFIVEGPPIRLPAKLALPFTLSLHELCTNAAKYGALSRTEGRVSLSWGYATDPGGGKFYLRWAEVGGPMVTPPAHEGFGSRVMKNAFSSEFGGSSSIEYRPEGLIYELILPADQIAARKALSA